MILYVKCLVTIDGFSLFQALKACRNQVARGKSFHLSLAVCFRKKLQDGTLIKYSSFVGHGDTE